MERYTASIENGKAIFRYESGDVLMVFEQGGRYYSQSITYNRKLGLRAAHGKKRISKENYDYQMTDAANHMQ